MWDFNLTSVFSLMGKTMPFLIFRLLIYVGISVGYVLATGSGAGVGWLVGKILGDVPAGVSWGGLAGFGIFSTVLYFAREYLLYMVKAGHIAVLVELMDGKELPEGKGQITYAQQEVRKRFTTSSVLFGVDQLIKGILKTFNGIFFTIAHFIPIPGLKDLVKILSAMVNMSLTYLDEVILAYHMRSNSDNPWKSSQDAIVLYGQNYKSILKNAIFLTIIIWALTLFVFILILAPVAAFVSIFPAFGSFWSFLFAAIFAYGIKAAVIEPIAMTALMQVFFKVTQGQEPNPEWQEKIAKISDKFRALTEKAKQKITGGGTESAGTATTLGPEAR